MLSVLSVVVALIWLDIIAALALAILILALVVPRALRLRPSFDIAYGIVLLIASWSGVLELYTSVFGLDIVVHFVANGLVAALMYVLAARFKSVPDPLDRRVPLVTITLLTLTFGLAAAAFWEFTEWVSHTYIDENIFVGYDDSIGDMAAGGIGSILAGLAMRELAAQPTAAGTRAAAVRSSAR